MSMNEADTRYHLIDPVLRAKGYVSRNQMGVALLERGINCHPKTQLPSPRGAGN